MKTYRDRLSANPLLASSAFLKQTATLTLFVAASSTETIALGGETDPYTNRDADIQDSLAVLDHKVNNALNRISSEWKRECDERAFIFAVYRDLGGRHWVDKIERWAMFTPEVDRLPTKRADSLFHDAPTLLSIGVRLGNFTRTIKVSGTHISTDKLGHFFSQGRKFYFRYERVGTIKGAARLTALWENLLWGGSLSGVYSNADLVANYEGFLFYRGLFNQGIVEGKDAIFRCENGSLLKQREFTWADHVNPFWDEMLNPSYFRPSLVPAVKRRMLRLCVDYLERPTRYQIENPIDLQKRYRLLAMRDTNIPTIAKFLHSNCKVPTGTHQKHGE